MEYEVEVVGGFAGLASSLTNESQALIPGNGYYFLYIPCTSRPAIRHLWITKPLWQNVACVHGFCKWPTKPCIVSHVCLLGGLAVVGTLNPKPKTSLKTVRPWLMSRLFNGCTEGILSEATVLQSFRDEPPGSITIRSGVELEVPWLQYVAVVGGGVGGGITTDCVFIWRGTRRRSTTSPPKSWSGVSMGLGRSFRLTLHVLTEL